MNQSVHPIHFRPTVPSGHPSAERWSLDAIQALFDLPLNDLLLRAQTVHRQHFEPNQVELATLSALIRSAGGTDLRVRRASEEA